MGVADRAGSKKLYDSKWMEIDAVLEEVRVSLQKGMIKHASMHSPHEGHSVIEEEYEELWDHVKADTGRSPEARKEALQLAAMAVRYIVDLIDGDDRG